MAKTTTLDLSRRSFVTSGACLLCAACADEAVVDDTGEVRDPGPGPAVVDGGHGDLSFPYADFPELQKAGGTGLKWMEGVGPILVVRQAGDTVVAVLNVCTHRGCSLAFRDAEQDFRCNCHGARFDLQGEVLEGPAERPITLFGATVDDMGITVHPEDIDAP